MTDVWTSVGVLGGVALVGVGMPGHFLVGDIFASGEIRLIYSHYDVQPPEPLDQRAPHLHGTPLSTNVQKILNVP